MVRWTTLCIVGCWLAAARPGLASATEACLSCHPSARGLLSGPMATRAAERSFARRAFGPGGDAFFAESCKGCHVTGCADCHGERLDAAAAPKVEACLRCHRGYFVGWEYLGRAPREDHSRYQRGSRANGEPFMKMLPDVHAERGMTCGDCHTMRSLQEGRRSAKTCEDCHRAISKSVPEHAIAAHLQKMECAACHSAWGAQEYGTFLVRALTEEQKEAFSPLPAWGPWRKSAYLKRQDPPPLGLNARGKVSPIRPQFVLFATDPSVRSENRLLVAEWKAFFPHTVRRGTVTCSGCHDSPRRYLQEEDADRLYLLEKDGMPLRSFWSQQSQTVVNGSFFPRERHDLMNRKTPEYVRQYLKQWQNLLKHADPPSGR
jgi:hypothetical protein